MTRKKPGATGGKLAQARRWGACKGVPCAALDVLMSLHACQSARASC